MKILYSEESFKLAKNTDLLPCQCYNCHKVFYKNKKRIKDVLNPNTSDKGRYCSTQCRDEFRTIKVNVKCLNCNTDFLKDNKELIRSPNHFCSKSCAAKYNNKNKIHGTRRSKIEIYFQNKLTELFPNLRILYNQKFIIGSELDIYIPSLKLGFELNGIFHYQPIYGANKLKQIQTNDLFKMNKCKEEAIILHSINISSLSNFNESGANQYLNTILNIIADMKGVEPSEP